MTAAITGDLFADAPGSELPAAAAATAPSTTPRAAPRLALAQRPGAGQAAVARELWLCLWLPRLPLEALCTDPSRPAAAVEGTGSQRRIVACNAAATRSGIAPGQGLNAALALLPQVLLHERDAGAEQRLLGRLARWATQFTPLVSDEPDALLLEVRGSRRLFGGAEPLRRRAAAGLADLGYTLRATLAPTPRAALWLARAGIEASITTLDALPVLAARLPLACLHWPDATIEALTRFGAASVADLMRLPRDGLARRLGPGFVDELDEAFGRRPAPRRRVVQPQRFVDSLDLPAELESTAQLEPAAAILVGRLCEFLRARTAGVGGFLLEFQHLGLPPTHLRLGLVRPSGDERHLQGLLAERLSHLALPAPARALRLRSGPVLPVEATTSGLWPAQGPDGARQSLPDTAAAARLVERLRARLGNAEVFGMRAVAEHRPESAWRLADPALESAGPGRGQVRRRAGGADAPSRAAAPAAGGPRPLWMLAGPLPLTERDGLPRHEGPLVLVGGPERIESGWWDGHDVRRDYYVAESRAGTRLWVYRERGAAGGWFLHGIFG